MHSTIVDALIVLALLVAFFRGYARGLIQQAGSTIGFIGGIVAGSWVGTYFIHDERTVLAKALTSIVAALCGGFICMGIGESLGRHIKQRVSRTRILNTLDGTFGSLMGAATTLFAIWLLAAIVVLSPIGTVAQLLKNSQILAKLDTTLPPATSVLSSLNGLIDPNGFPQVFNGLEPSQNTAVSLPALGNFTGVVQSAEASVVKVEGTGCGGIVEGSAFVIAPDEVVTNAHVIAGVASPKVLDTNGVLHNTRVVWFDPDVDLAVLRVPNLVAAPLEIDSTEQSTGTPGVVLGYPGGGDFNVQPAAVIEHFTALGRNIYGQGTTSRDVYSLKAHIIPGNSGGPLISTSGQVLGIVFATSTSYNNVGYALTGQQIAGELTSAEQATAAVTTGACSE